MPNLNNLYLVNWLIYETINAMRQLFGKFLTEKLYLEKFKTVLLYLHLIVKNKINLFSFINRKKLLLPNAKRL